MITGSPPIWSPPVCAVAKAAAVGCSSVARVTESAHSFRRRWTEVDMAPALGRTELLWALTPRLERRPVAARGGAAHSRRSANRSTRARGSPRCATQAGLSAARRRTRAKNKKRMVVGWCVRTA